MGPRYYVIATLGAAPAVLSELLWSLVMREDADVAGLEVWTTGGDPPPPPSGQARLEAFDDAGHWSTLLKALGDRAHRVPRPRQRVALDAVPQAIAAGQRTWCVSVFGAPAAPLADVRSPEDAQAMEIELHARVRHLRLHLPADVVLLGSLAGGRKTMSAALQTAFTLQAGPRDKLVHVLLHPSLEPLERREAFVVPDPTLPVPLDEQVALHEVWYPRLRRLFADAALQTGKTLLDHFDREPYGELVRRLRQAETDARARLSRPSLSNWRYWIGRGGLERDLTLTPREGTLLGALTLHPEGLTAQDLVDWMAERALVETGDDEATVDRNLARVRTQVTRLRQRLADLPTIGLADFVPTRGDGPGRLYRIPAADRITFDPRDLEDDHAGRPR